VRREMVKEIRNLKSTLQSFEQAYLKKNGRLPKSVEERGQMAVHYEKYKTMKRVIR